MISIHAPTRGATCWWIRDFSKSVFQSTLPRGERLLYFLGYIRDTNFNPRSHEGSDLVAAGFYRADDFISIHAPTRGATSTERRRFPAITFQSTLPRGERLSGFPFNWLLRYFNPRSHEGSDRFSRPVIAHVKPFQSTLPRGERRNKSVIFDFNHHYFNPRSHEGSDTLF